MSDFEVALLFAATVVGGVGTGFGIGRWRRKKEERALVAKLLAEKQQATEQLAWKRGCGGNADVTD